MRTPALLLLLVCLAAAASGPALAESTEEGLVAAAEERPWLTPRRVGSLKAGIALAGAALLAWTAWDRRQPAPRRRRRLQDALLLGLGLTAGIGWWNFTAFNHPGFGHPSDTFHYYVGSKYFPELGYQRLYLCAAVADVEAGLRGQVEGRSLRDLASNQLVSAAAAIEHPQDCTSHFTPMRWTSFARDVGWFRNHVSSRRWQAMQTDHGYNATPLWTALGGWLANRVPASDASILALRLIDPLLLLAMWAAIAFSFGWQAACVAGLYWGTNYPAQYGWTGGGFLRQGWLVATLLALCALRRERPVLAGGLLALAAGLRVFPIFVLAALGVKALVEMRKAGRARLAPEHRRLAAGAVATGAALFALSLLSGDGARAWTAFASDSRAHLATPLRNYMGLATVVAWQPAAPAPAEKPDLAPADPYAAWKDARRGAAEGRRWIWFALVAGYLALLARAAARQLDWRVGALGVGLITIAAELTCYYSAGLLAFGLLWPRRPAIAIALCGLSAAGWWIAGSGRGWDEVFTAISLASVIFIVWTTWLLGSTQVKPE